MKTFAEMLAQKMNHPRPGDPGYEKRAWTIGWSAEMSNIRTVQSLTCGDWSMRKWLAEDYD